MRIRETWVLTVVSLRNSFSATSAFERPFETSRRTSCSRSVRSGQLVRRGRLRRGQPAGEPVEQPARDRRREECLAGGHHADRLDEILRRGVLQQEPAGPGAERLEHVFVEIEGREDQDLDWLLDARPCQLSAWPRRRP